MGMLNWENCVSHYDDGVTNFFAEYFSEGKQKCLLIGGAGFDPRGTEFVGALASILRDRLNVSLIKEIRPNPDINLVLNAENNLKKVQDACSEVTVCNVNILAEDNAVVGGRNAITSISKMALNNFSDIVIDISALSLGVSFPIVRYIYEYVKKHHQTINVHLVVVSNPELDTLIRSIPNDRASEVRGFPRANLFGENETARLWMPQLMESKKSILSMIYEEVAPHDTCPILPFPSEDPKKGDRIACSLIPNLENEWSVDPRNLVYADERKPLDIYRTILRIHDERCPVFSTFGGSTIILSPLGGKIPAIGALMAALERKFPIVYVEALEYNVDWAEVDNLDDIHSKMVHVWLYGEAYLSDINRG